MVGNVPAQSVAATASGRAGNRALTLLLACVLATMVPSVPAAVAAESATEPMFVFEGRGWGHGVGMPQYGAYGQALEGATAEEIVTYYYTGTYVTDAAELPIPDDERDRPLWIGLEQSVAEFTVTWEDAAGTICIDPDPTNEESPCSHTVNVRVDETMTFTWNADTGACAMVRTKVGGEEKPLGVVAPECRVSMAAETGGVLRTDEQGLPSGSLELRRAAASEAFHAVAVLELETYLSGLAEVFSWWPAPAIEAQMLAARSYALNRYLTFEVPELRAPGDAGIRNDVSRIPGVGQKDLCWCHLFDTDSSQVYGGVDAMLPEFVAAAEATQGRVIAYDGGNTRHGVTEAYYSSSSGGTTLSNVVAWGSSTQFPYLVPVDDPWSLAPEVENPFASWTHEVSAAAVAANLGWDAVTGAWMVETDPPRVRFVGIDDGVAVSTELQGDLLRSRAGRMRSGYVTALHLEGPPVCNGYFATIWGTPQPDELVGTGGDDVIVGMGGADIIEGRGGDDLICGSGGGDTISGNNGADTIFGGNGDDVIDGGGGLDTLSGGGGADTIRGGNGADTVDGDKGLDTLDGDNGADTIRGGAGADTIDGGSGSDTIYGSAGADDLRGGDHADVLWGGSGPDTLDGGEADDICRGGDGADEATAACEIVISIP